MRDPDEEDQGRALASSAARLGITEEIAAGTIGRPPAASIATTAAAASIATIAAAASAVIATTTATRATARIASPSPSAPPTTTGSFQARPSPRRGDRYGDRRGGYDRGYDRYDDRRGGDRFDDRRSRSPPRARLGRASRPPGPPSRRSRPPRRRFPRLLRSPPERDWGALAQPPGPAPARRTRPLPLALPRTIGTASQPHEGPPRDDRDVAEDLARARADAAGDRWGKTDLPSRGDRDDRDDRERGGRPRLNLKARSAVRALAPRPAAAAIFGGARPEAALKEAGRDFIKEDLALSAARAFVARNTRTRRRSRMTSRR